MRDAVVIIVYIDIVNSASESLHAQHEQPTCTYYDYHSYNLGIPKVRAKAYGGAPEALRVRRTQNRYAGRSEHDR